MNSLIIKSQEMDRCRLIITPAAIIVSHGLGSGETTRRAYSCRIPQADAGNPIPRASVGWHAGARFPTRPRCLHGRAYATCDAYQTKAAAAAGRQSDRESQHGFSFLFY